MALPIEQQAKYWGIATAVVFAILWFLGDVILPFVLGGAIAYCLDPLADRLEKLGASRVLATVTITIVAILIFCLAFLLVIPSLLEQAGQLVNTAPDVFERLRVALTERFPSLIDDQSVMRKQLSSIGQAIQAKGGALVEGLLTSAKGLINILVLLVLVPVVAFYLLLDWDKMTARVDELLPRDHAPTIRKLARDIDATLASFIRGMGMVCLVLGTYYAVALMTVGLQFGLIVGFIAGLVTFIPYVGALVGGILAIGLALFQFWSGTQMVDGTSVQVATDWVRIGAVGVIFVVGQVVEGNVLTPKLVGKSVGLHPVWLIFALSVFGSIFGFVGMLVAVPLAAMIGVLVRFGIEQYTEGRLYRGLDNQD